MKFTKEELQKIREDLPEKLKEFRNSFCSGSDSLPIDIFKILDRMGFEVYYAKLGKLDGAMIIDESINAFENFKSNKLMLVNSKLSYENSVFTLAHELAHYLAYKWINPDKRVQVEFREHGIKGVRGDTEHCMDYIAASILMPEEIFKKSLAQKNIYKKGDPVSADVIDSLAKLYGVEFEAAKRRVSEVLV